MTTPLLDCLTDVMGGFQDACSRERSWLRLSRHVLSDILCLGRHTITGLIRTSGQQGSDWSADYRLYSKGRFDPDNVFSSIRRDLISSGDVRPAVFSMDDTIIPKCGSRIPGVAYRRDPLGPKFHLNLVKALRAIQIAVACPEEDGSAGMIPIAFEHAPTAKRPGKKSGREEWALYKEEQKKLNLSRKGVDCMRTLRKQIDDECGVAKGAWMTVDGSFTNRTVLKGLPERMVLIGRVRADMKLYDMPNKQPLTGRRAQYGSRIQTPEELLKDKSKPYVLVKAHAAGKDHMFKVKTIEKVMWRAAGAEKKLRLIVIAPLGYRLKNKSRILYRRPAYLICTDPSIQLTQVIQAYVWRWGIEVNFRDEKTLFGLGEAQVRNGEAVTSTLKKTVSAYSSLLLAGKKAFPDQVMSMRGSEAKWYPAERKRHVTTSDLISRLRWEVWGRGIEASFSNFATLTPRNSKPQKLFMPLLSAVLGATG